MSIRGPDRCGVNLRVPFLWERLDIIPVVDRGHHLYGRLSEIKARTGKAKYERRPEDAV